MSREPAKQRTPATISSGYVALVLSEDDDPVDDIDAKREHHQRPPGVGAADREQCPESAGARLLVGPETTSDRIDR
jgi:hypothetical protein